MSSGAQLRVTSLISAATAVLGVAGVPPRVALLAAFVAFHAIWLPRYFGVKQQAFAAGYSARWWRGLILLVALAAAFSFAAYATGVVLGMVWSVWFTLG